MSAQTNLSPNVNFEFLRKQAKSLLKLCRSRDKSALERILTQLPRLVKLDGRRAAAEIRLADIQHALARERGFTNWVDLKRHGVRNNIAPDYSAPNSDGTLPDGYNPWGWCLSYTLRPELRGPLVIGREYRICVSVLRKAHDNEEFTGYAGLYNRATDIANARAAIFEQRAPGQILHKRILTQGWFRHKNFSLVRAFLTIGLTPVSEGDARPEGLNAPAPQELKSPGGMTPDNYDASTARHHQQFHELYSDNDGRDASPPTGVFLVSYGEFVETCKGIDYEPFVERAEQLARSHYRFLTKEHQPLQIVRREWFCATKPDIAVVHVYIRL
jgi:hypothetical protein